MRQYPYRITLVMYNGMHETHYIMASNHRDAFEKAHYFANPIAYTGKYGGVQFILDTKLTKAYIEEHNIRIEKTGA